jgi:hypothetical protein
MKRFLFPLTIMIFFFISGGFAMLQEMPLNKLAAEADIIAFARVVKVKPVGKTKEGYQMVANLITVREFLKGNATSTDQLKVKTFSNMEDSAKFRMGEVYLLFLKKVENHYVVVNGLQGSWGIDSNGAFLGMGHGKNLSQVKKAIKNPPAKEADQEEPILF